MNKNRLSKITILLLVMMMLFSSTVFAVNIPITQDMVPLVTEVLNKTHTDLKGTGEGESTTIKVLSKGGRDGNTEETILSLGSNELVFDAVAFKNSNNREAKKALTAFINNLKDSSIPLDSQQDIMTTIQESDSDVASIMIPLIFDESKADLYTAYKWLYPFLQILRVVFGVGAIAIVLLLIGSTIMDMVYIGLPVWREVQNEKGGGSQKHPFGVSYEAIKTVKEIEASLGEGGYRNAYILYFKRRALTYVVLAICLLYLIVGELGGLISWILSLGSGIVG